MALKALGKITVTTAGTRVRITSGQSVPGANISCQSITVQAWPANTGRIYVGTVAVVGSTGVGVYGYVPIPASDGTTSPGMSLGVEGGGNALNAADFYLDASVNGDSAIVTIIER